MTSFGKMLYKCTGVKHYWVINNSSEIVEYVNKINDRRSGRNITTFDFTTLYTKLSHSDILECLDEVIDLAFKKSKYKYVSVYANSARWSNNPRKSTFRFDSTDLKEAVKFILVHSYFSVGTTCFRQNIGVPIGIDCAPEMANLTLFWYEYCYISRLLKSDYRRALRYNGCFRLMDDISCLNLDGVFQQDVHNIYPSSLVLNKENSGDSEANILDLTITLDSGHGTFAFKLYDKRDAFKFEIINYPDICGNIAASCCYGVVKSELMRYSKLSSTIFDFNNRKDALFGKLVAKKYSLSKISRIADSIGSSM